MSSRPNWNSGNRGAADDCCRPGPPADPAERPAAHLGRRQRRPYLARPLPPALPAPACGARSGDIMTGPTYDADGYEVYSRPHRATYLDGPVQPGVLYPGGA